MNHISFNKTKSVKNNEQSVKDLKRSITPSKKIKHPTVVLIHAIWCGHCQNFKPEWKQFVQKAKNHCNTIDIEFSELETLRTQYNSIYRKLLGLVPQSKDDATIYFPMIVVFNQNLKTNNMERTIYDGHRSSVALIEYIDNISTPLHSTKRNVTLKNIEDSFMKMMKKINNK